MLGWRGWEEYQTRHAREAASLYYQMYDDLASQFEQQVADADDEADDEADDDTDDDGGDPFSSEASTPTSTASTTSTPTELPNTNKVIAREMEAIKELQENLKLKYDPELFETLREQYKDTVYPAMAYLEIARVDVENGDLEKAVDKLNWVARTTTHIVLKHIADIRRARVLTALGQYDDALTVLKENEFPKEMIYLVEEARGDAYAGMGNKEDAVEAYEKAIKEAARPSDFLQMKLDNLGHPSTFEETDKDGESADRMAK